MFIGLPYSLNRTSPVAFNQRDKGQNIEVFTQYTPSSILNKTQTIILDHTTSLDVDGHVSAVIIDNITNPGVYRVSIDYTITYDDIYRFDATETGNMSFTSEISSILGGSSPSMRHEYEGRYPSKVSVKRGNGTDLNSLFVYLKDINDGSAEVTLAIKEY